MKKQSTNYYLFLFFSSFSRNLIEVYSLVILYKKGYSLNNILIFLLITYLTGIASCHISLIIKPKLTLILSNIFYGISFLYLSKMANTLYSLLIFAILFSLSNYSYHIIRHYYALHMLENKKSPRIIVMIIYISSTISSLLGSILLDKVSPFFTSTIVLMLSSISCIPIFKYKIESTLTYNLHQNKKVNISIDKIIFSILEQFKVIFLEIQPLFLYLYIKKSYLYIGIFNIIMSISSLLVVFYLSKKINNNKMKYITSLLGIILLLKINQNSKIYLLLIAIFEGILIKLYETYSIKNLYDIEENNIKNYLKKEENIFLITKSCIIIIWIITRVSLKTILSIHIIGIILSGFFLKKKK